MIYKILTHPNKELRKKSQKVLVAEICTPEKQKFLINMSKTMITKDGIGLAAPQIGVLKRIITIAYKDKVLVLINPILTKKSWLKEVEEEGCLSVPGVYGLVKRHHKLFVTAYNEQGKKVEFEAKGLLARIIQHEVDHLDGVLFIDKVIKITQGVMPETQ
ncbi:MAG: Peptide deformylase [Parcubacteria group bacterium GW2011_GWC2_39_14]|nr:MAG: Peptide deformylase [Parcubacteria group bacterium GW2011_GWC2_39_14]KKR55393.1 MAG: Peptide deformylase [Parcubacteria group bacterium GW2011_GWA2_40_23]